MLGSIMVSNESTLWAHAPTVDQAPRCSYGSRGLLSFLDFDLNEVHLRLHNLEKFIGSVFVRDGAAERGRH